MINFRKNMRNMIPNSQPEAKDHEVNVNGGQALCVVDPGKDSHLPSGRGGDQDFRGGAYRKCWSCSSGSISTATPREFSTSAFSN